MLAPDQAERIRSIQIILLEWFAAHARDLPWRQTRDPYRVLVSEVMLQQTQVDRVIPRYHAFLDQFPTLQALAEAPTADVIRAWAGLGYNRRAVNLQRTARAVLEQHGGEFPRSVEALRQLPGIGPYTAGAVACFAFEQDVAFLDTNIRRAVLRLLMSQQPAPGEREITAVAEQLVPSGQGWAWNQAIMELGALICTAATPTCWRCPLNQNCRDYSERQQADTNAFEQPLYFPTDAAQRIRKPHKKVAEKREEPFIGSNRYYRGRVIAALREAPHGLSLPELGPQVKDDYSSADLPWLEQLVAGLARDGLLDRHDDLIHLPS
ncbi:MAG: A/G-specific adenine glycosylase [Roseiflexaceae bacterium]